MLECDSDEEQMDTDHVENEHTVQYNEIEEQDVTNNTQQEQIPPEYLAECIKCSSRKKRRGMH